jgi:hypothetical protein
MVPVEPVTDEHPAVDCTTREPLVADNNSPPPVTVQLPQAPFPGRAPTLTESDVVEPQQPSAVDPISPTVRLPKPAEPRQARFESSVTVRFFSSAIKCNRSLSPCHYRNSTEKTWSLSSTLRMYPRRLPHLWTPMPPSMGVLLPPSVAL